MADKTKIEWSDATWTPIRARHRKTGNVGWHCVHVSEACRNCYAERINARLGTRIPFKPGHLQDIDLFLDEKMLFQPLRWHKPRMIFVCSMTDLFADFVSLEWIDRIFAVMALCPQHTFQILTKRPDRMRAYFAPDYRGAIERIFNFAHSMSARFQVAGMPAAWPLPNVWLGTSCEDQAAANERIPHLLQCPAVVRFASAEPLLGKIDFTRINYEHMVMINSLTGEGGVPVPHIIGGPALNQIIVGGESGPNARPMHPQWARDIRDQCAAAGVPFFFKQWGEWIPIDSEKHHSDYAEACNGNGKWPFDKLLQSNGVILPGDSIQIGSRHYMRKVGKNRAGRMLDGVLHDAMPVMER